MAHLTIRKASIERLRPSPVAITDGSADPVAVTVVIGRGRDMTLQVDRDAAGKFARHRWVVIGLMVLTLAVTLMMGIMYGSAHPLAVAHPRAWALLAVAGGALLGVVTESYLKPKGYPRMLLTIVRLSNVDDAAAARWQAANDPDVINVRPDAPLRDNLLRHLPPIAMAVVVLAVGIVVLRLQ